MIQAFLSTKNKSQISSVSHKGKKSTSRKLIGLRTRAEAKQLAVFECDDHSSPVSVVSVELMIMSSGKGWKSKGIGKACPLCWTILQYPDGFEVA